MQNKPLIISLTTWTKRLPYVLTALQTIVKACDKANANGINTHIVFVLSEEEFPGGKTIQELDEYIQNNDIEVIVDEGNIKSHKKLMPTLLKYPDSDILIFDDDKIYPEDIVINFAETHNKYPNDIIVGTTFMVTIPKDNKVVVDFECNESIFLCRKQPEEILYCEKPANGCNGTLYPAHTFTRPEFFDRELMMKLSPTSDESWQFLFNVLEDRTLRIIGNTKLNCCSTIKDSEKCKLGNGPVKYSEINTKFCEVFPEFYTKLCERYEQYKKKSLNIVCCGLNPTNKFEEIIYNELTTTFKYLSINFEYVGYGTFFDSKKYLTTHYDYLIVQWPDNLINIPEESIKELKSTSTKIVTFVHNIMPHQFSIEKNNAYEIIYNNTDIFIHFGNYSKIMFEQLYTNAYHELLFHPAYYTKIFEKNKARDILKFSKTKAYCLIFGAQRNFLETKILEYLSCYENVIFVAPGFSKINKDNVISNIGVIDENFMNLYFSACDFVFIDRVNSLNSGVLPLALSYGKPVIGPSIGNIKEVLEDSNNFLYNPNDLSTINESFIKALNSINTTKGQENLNYAQNKIHPQKFSKLFLNILYKYK